jgi:hypothetical protein
MLHPRLYCFLFLTGLFCCSNGQAQVAQQVVGTAGGSSKALAGYTVDFTVGEMAIATAGADPSCTEGFNQPLAVRGLPDSNLINVAWYIKVFPNPVHDQLTIHAFMDRAGNMDLRLVDVLGRVQLVRQVAFQQGYNDLKLYTGSLARGIFVLYMTDVHGGHKTVKLLKE